ncbi:MAG: hypothetical protein DMF75_05345 [Acidobacteria bacterium]|nr:MAG: hypothetical protein DMF75_05345 [Acidobacteriota bacterium]
MKRTAILFGLIIALFIFSLLGVFGSSSASDGRSSNASDQSPQDVVGQDQASPTGQSQSEDNPGVDADLGKMGRNIDRETYLRLRDEYVARRRGIEPGRPFDPAARGHAIEQMERQEKGRLIESILNGGAPPPEGVDAAWTAIGPVTIPNGQALNNSNIAVTGRVTSIAVDPTNATKVYLVAALGGVWRSLDGGSTWTSIFDNAQTMAIGALALAPSNPTILYVGTGEFNSCGDCFFGVGLYRIDSVDTAPTLVGPINPSQTIGNLTYSIFNGRAITKILVHPTDPATIFVSSARGIGGSGANSLGLVPAIATRGLYRSTNATSAAGSVTFQKLTVTTDNSADSPGTGNEDTPDMVMEPGNPDNLLVTTIGPVGSIPSLPSGIYRTTNATTTASFTRVLSLPNNTRASFAINKVASVVTVYAATSETPTSTPGCTSSGSGALRKQIDPFNLSATWSTQLTGGGGFCDGQCDYDMPIAVNPNDPNEVYLGGNARGGCADGMKKSTNGGLSFTRDDNSLHADSHALVYDGAGTTIFTGNDGGVWKRSSSGNAGSAWTNLNKASLNTLQFQGIAVHPLDRDLMIGGTQDNGTEYQQTSPGNWRNAEGGDGGYALIDQSATNTTNVTMYHTFYNFTGEQIGFDRTVNTACLPLQDSWPTRGAFGGSNVLTPVPCDGTAAYLQNGININDNVLFYAPMALGPGAPNTLYFGTDRLYRSTDRGDTMTVASQAPINSAACGSLGSPCPISSIAIWPQGDNVRMVGLAGGQIWATSTGSSTLVNITSASFPANPNGSANKFVGRVVIDPNNKNTAYVAFSFYAPAGQGIWKITNLVAASGTSPAAPIWNAAANGIPSIPINALVIDPLNSNVLYAGTDIGVYSSTDGGANWAPFGAGFPRVAVFDLAIQPSNRILRAGTHGRGVWEIPLISPGSSTVQFQGSSSQSITEGQVSMTITITRSGDISFPASVNYATSDNAGNNDCSVTNGAASARCDYIATSGTLNFAANEAAKNILIPIVDDSYAEGPETFSLTLSNPGGINVSLGSPSVLTITINDNDASNGPNQIDVSSFFVRQHYIDFLNREADSAGLSFWTNNVDNCTPKPSCTELQRINTSAAFFISIEFQNTGYLVERIYKVAFGSSTGNSTTGGAHTLQVPVVRLSEFLPDTQKIGQGVVVNVGDWQQQLENNKLAFTEEFVTRSRFLTAFPLTMTAAQFVNTMNTNSGGALSQSDRDNLVQALTNGTMTRAQVLRAIAENQTLYNAEFNRAFVLMQFFGYLRRNPNDFPDADYTGFEFWLNKLNSFNGNFVAAEMVKAFITSTEYRKRFGPA